MDPSPFVCGHGKDLRAERCRECSLPEPFASDPRIRESEAEGYRYVRLR